MKYIKSVLFAGLTAAVLFGASAMPQHASAQTTASLQAQITALLAQVQALQAQLAARTGGGSSVTSTTSGEVRLPPFCHTFNVNLRIGDQGSEVAALQNALLHEGIGISNSEISAKSFGESTAEAVSLFQEKYRADILAPAGLAVGNGYVGAFTRAKLNALYGVCGISTGTVKVFSPNGGEVLVENSKLVDSLSSVDSNQNIFEIKWSGAPDSFTDVYGNGKDPARIAAYLEQRTGSQFTTIGRIVPEGYGSIMWIVGQVSNTNCLMNNDNATLYANHCYHSRRLVSPGSYYVKIVDTQTGVMDWSDAPFTITDSNQNSVTVFSPNGGESWQFGTKQGITYTAPADAAYVSIYAQREYSCPPGAACPLYYPAPQLISSPNNTGIFTWVVGKALSGDQSVDLPPGSYRIRVDAGKGRMDESDKPFTITIGNQSSLTVLSPNGGETFFRSQDNLIRWSGGSYPVQVGIVTSRFPEDDTVVGWINTGANADGSLYWDGQHVGPLDYQTSGQSWVINPGQYKVIVVSRSSTGNYCFNGRGECLYDVSDAPFTLSANPIDLDIPPLVVLSPNRGETYHIGDTLTIHWTPGQPGISQIYLVSATRNYSNNIMATAPNTSGVWSLQIPENFPPDSYWVDIYRLDGAQGFADRSDIPFTIAAAQSTPFTFTYPSANAALLTGQAYTATWRGGSTNMESYQALLVGGPSNVTLSLGVAVASQHSFRFTVPSTAPAGSGYRLSFRGPAFFEETSGFSIVRPSGSVTPISQITSGGAFIHNLYKTFYLRDPSDTDSFFRTRLDAFNSGEPVANIYHEFLGDGEFSQKQGSISNRDYVRLMYRTVLYRDADDSGVDFWVTDLDSGRKNKDDMLNAFLVSGEFVDGILPKLNALRPTPTFGAASQTNGQLANILDSARSILDGLQAWFQ